MDEKEKIAKLESSDSGRLVAKLKEEKPPGLRSALLELLVKTAKRLGGGKYLCAISLSLVGCASEEHPHYEEERIYIRRECGGTRSFYEAPTRTSDTYR